MKGLGKFKRAAIIGICLAIAALDTLTMTGCGGGRSERESVSLVVGAHKYHPQPNLTAQAIYDEVYKTCESFGNVSAVVVDGDPSVVCNYELKEPAEAVDDEKIKQIAGQNTKQIITRVTTIEAKVPEIDTLSAIIRSANTLQSSNNKKKSMVILDSGLSTTSLLNFAEQDIIATPKETVIEQLKERKAIPNLEGIDIKWSGLGETCGEQTGLTQKYRYQLKALWNDILKAGGAKTVYFDSTPSNGKQPSEDLPACTTVPVVEDPLEIPEQSAVEDIPEIIKWDDNSNIRFKADRAEFVSREDANKELKSVAEYLNANNDKRLYIIGMTATVPSKDKGFNLSLKRAETCKDLLVGQMR